MTILFGFFYCLLTLSNFVVLLIAIDVVTDTTSFIEKVKSAKIKTDEILSAIDSKWQIKDYPNFLNSAAMTHTAWEVLKVRFICICC